MAKNTFLILQLPLTSSFSIEGSTLDEWAQTLLNELEEELDEKDRQEGRELFFEGELLRHQDRELGEVVLFTGTLKARFQAYCVRSCEPTWDDLNAKIKAAFVDTENKELCGGDDEIEVAVKEQVWDLYFYERNKLDIAPIVHEAAFLNKNPYPKSDAPIQELD